MSINPADFDSVADLLKAYEALKGDKKATRQPRNRQPASKPYPREKEFVCIEYFTIDPQFDFTHTIYNKRDKEVTKVVHLYNETDEGRMRKIAMTSDVVVLHPHPWNIPCPSAPAQMNCRVIKERNILAL